MIIQDNTEEVLEAIAKAKKAALKAIGMTAETYAKEITPVDTGRLRNSITHVTEGDTAYIGTNVEYAPYIENGSRNHRPHHMLQRAATEHTDEYRQLVEDAFKSL